MKINNLRSTLDKKDDTKHSMILGRPNLEVTPEIIEKSGNIVVKRYRDRFFPLRFLGNYKISEYVVNNNASNPVKMPLEVNEDLCKIWGAMAADGHITTKSKADYILQITDGDFSAIEAFQRWFKNCFDIAPNIYKYKKFNAWRMCCCNKIIGRYLVDALGFPINKKSSTIKVPEFLETKAMKEAFLIGVFTFDAGVDLNGNIEYSINNGEFFKSVIKILQDLDVSFAHSGNTDVNGFWRFHTYKLSKQELTKWKGLFEKNTEKYFKVMDLLIGYNKMPHSEEEVLLSFEKTFPLKNASLTSLKEVYLFLRNIKTTNVSEISNKLNIKKDTTIKYRELLKKCNIIKEERIYKGKDRITISFNEDLSSWRIPWREHYGR